MLDLNHERAWLNFMSHWLSENKVWYFSIIRESISSLNPSSFIVWIMLIPLLRVKNVLTEQIICGQWMRLKLCEWLGNGYFIAKNAIQTYGYHTPILVLFWLTIHRVPPPLPIIIFCTMWLWDLAKTYRFSSAQCHIPFLEDSKDVYIVHSISYMSMKNVYLQNVHAGEDSIQPIAL